MNNNKFKAKKISDLNELTDLSDDSLLIIAYNGKNYKSTTKQLTDPIYNYINTQNELYAYKTDLVGKHTEAGGEIFNNSSSANMNAHGEGLNTWAEGKNSHAEGMYSKSLGENSHAEGNNVKALGDNSHAEGTLTIANGDSSHAEGQYTTANNYGEHAEGKYNISNINTDNSKSTLHSIGGGDSINNRKNVFEITNNGDLYVYGIGNYKGKLLTNVDEDGNGSGNKIDNIDSLQNIINNISSKNVGKFTNTNGEIFNDYINNTANNYSHAEGFNNRASGDYSHTEGKDNSCSGQYSHIEGLNNIVNGDSSHSEGTNNKINNNFGHAEGGNNTVSADYAHAEGYYNNAIGAASHVEGSSTTASGNRAHAEGSGTNAIGDYSHAEGYESSTNNNCGHAEGFQTIAIGHSSHTEGYKTTTSKDYGHAEGFQTNVNFKAGHAEGSGTTSNAVYAHAEGFNTNANGEASHAEGNETESAGNYSHSEGGKGTKAKGNQSHAEGLATVATGDNSHTEGYLTQALNNGEHAEGRCNISNNGGTSNTTTLSSIGFGTKWNDRKNAVEVMNDGTMFIYNIGNYDGKLFDENSIFKNAKSLQEIINNKIETSIKLTYNELKNIKNNKKLTVGQCYIISDYVTTTKYDNTLNEKYKSAQHPFDLIVTAISDTEFSPIAQVLPHEGDTYFNGCDLSKWQIWYSFDNDSKYDWCDTNGKGIIYRMIDEFGNDCPYDFKNILYCINKENTEPYVSIIDDHYKWDVDVIGRELVVDETLWMYTFTAINDESPNIYSDASLSKYIINKSLCFNNIIKQYVHIDAYNMVKPVIKLNNIIIVNHFNTSKLEYYTVYNNYFSNDCNNIFMGGGYGGEWHVPTTGNYFNNSVNYIYMGKKCKYNIFGNKCNNIIFPTNSHNNIIYNNCYNIYSVKELKSNIFKNECSDIILNSALYNTFNECCNNINLINISELSDCIFENSVSTVKFISDYPVYNCLIKPGIGEIYPNPIKSLKLNKTFKDIQTVIDKKSNGKIIQYIPADLIDDSMNINIEPFVLKTTDTQYLGQAIPSLHSAGVISSPDGITQSEMEANNIIYFKNNSYYGDYPCGNMNWPDQPDNEYPYFYRTGYYDDDDPLNKVAAKHYKPGGSWASGGSQTSASMGIFYGYINNTWKNIVMVTTGYYNENHGELLIVGVGNPNWPAESDKGTESYVKLDNYLKTI